MFANDYTVYMPWCMAVALFTVVTCILDMHTQLVCVGVIMNEGINVAIIDFYFKCSVP